MEGFMRARASNYVRTHLTAAAVMEGLLGKEPGVQIPIEVRPAIGDTISVFESGRGLTEAMAQITSSAAYKAREKEMLHISSQLINGVPFFKPAPTESKDDVLGTSPATALTSQQQIVKESMSASADVTPLSNGGNKSAPVPKSTTFQWIRAMDLFHAFKAHSLPLPLPSGLAEGEAKKMEILTGEHLLWRFRTLFGIPHALALAAAGLFGEVAEVFTAPFDAEASNESSKRQPLFTLISGHDVTLLPALYGLVPLSTPDAAAAASFSSPTALPARIAARFTSAPNRWQWLDRQRALVEVPWPVYSATLTIEQSAENPRVLLWSLSNEVGRPKTAPDAEKERAQINKTLTHCLLAAGPTPRNELPFADNAAPHPSYLSPDARLSEEDAAAAISAAGKDAAVGMPSHLRHRLRVDGNGGFLQPDDVIEMTGAVLLEDLVIFSSILKDIEGPAILKYAPADSPLSAAWAAKRTAHEHRRDSRGGEGKPLS
jgi:hypothetical protein